MKNRLRNRLKGNRSHSLHQRLTITIFFVTMVSLLSSAIVSYIALISMERNKTESAMEATLQQMTNSMDQSYFSMLQISRQMLPQGNTGLLFEEYLEAKNPYDTYRLKGKLNEALVNISFPNSELCMLSYYDPADEKNRFSSFSFVDDFDPERQKSLVTVGTTRYQTCHPSQRRYQKGIVISLTGTANFLKAPDVTIYLESLVDMAAYTKENENTLGESFSFLLLQADENGVIRYSSDEEQLDPMDGYQISDFLKDGEMKGTTKKYFVVAKESPIGYTNLILIHLSDYKKELNSWIRRIALVGAVSLFMFYIAIMIIYRLVYRPIEQLEREFERLGEGSFEITEYNSGIEEFDRLTGQFNRMKQQIQALLEKAASDEQVRHRMETEKLMYQINPHFLMNTLNSVKWLAKLHQQKEISEFVTELISMLAYNLGKTDKVTTFRTEVGMLRNYINLQKVRYDFEAVIEVEEGDYLDSPTVRMLLQPLVENAIRYGIGESGIIQIRMFSHPVNRIVVITIEDKGVGLTKEELDKLSQPFSYSADGRSENDGIGLRYVRSMLDSYYKGNAFLTINSEPGKGTKITLLLPMDWKEEENDSGTDRG